MSRELITIIVSAVLLHWPSLAWSDANARAEVSADATLSISEFRSQSQRLEAALERHRALAAAGGWPTVPNGPTIRPGAADSRLEALALRLTVSGDLPEQDRSTSTATYDETLQSAVRRFQKRHGLDVDALVGPATLRALNRSIEQRIEQIRINLERASRFSEIEDDEYVLINIPAFQVYVIRGGKTLIAAKVIVGEKDDKTPEFTSALKTVVINPTWTVPYSIASEEMLPKIKEDPNFFDRGKYQLFDRSGAEVDPSSIDWNSIDIRTFPFTLVQQPGPRNQLGQIKFMFPNEYSVCMHDTPAKVLFDKVARAFSHGCIRLDEPLTFASVILDDEGWTRARIDSQIESGETMTVALAEPIPLFVFYWTAEVDDLGAIYFYDDIYQRDAAFVKILE